MDTSKHTVTIPISDYEELVHRSHTLSMYHTVLDKIEKTMRDKSIDRDTKYARIQTVINNWCPEHDLEEDHY